MYYLYNVVDVIINAVCNPRVKQIVSTLAEKCNVHAERDKLLLDLQWEGNRTTVSDVSGRKQFGFIRTEAFVRFQSQSLLLAKHT